jgi:hypothetical protein
MILLKVPTSFHHFQFHWSSSEVLPYSISFSFFDRSSKMFAQVVQIRYSNLKKLFGEEFVQLSMLIVLGTDMNIEVSIRNDQKYIYIYVFQLTWFASCFQSFFSNSSNSRFVDFFRQAFDDSINSNEIFYFFGSNKRRLMFCAFEIEKNKKLQFHCDQIFRQLQKHLLFFTNSVRIWLNEVMKYHSISSH